MKRNGRARNPRRIILDELRLIKRTTSDLISRWSVEGTVYVPHDGGPKFSGHFRPRERHEYPENQAEAWRNLARYARWMVDRWTQVAEVAERKAEALEGEAASQ